MKMAIYGLPCAGKSTLISKIDFASHIDGSAGDIAIEKHFSFPSEEGYSITSSDNVSDSYDAVAYLDTAPDIILERMKQSEDYNRYSDLTEEALKFYRKAADLGDPMAKELLKGLMERMDLDYIIIDDP